MSLFKLECVISRHPAFSTIVAISALNKIVTMPTILQKMGDILASLFVIWLPCIVAIWRWCTTENKQERYRFLFPLVRRSFFFFIYIYVDCINNGSHYFIANERWRWTAKGFFSINLDYSLVWVFKSITLEGLLNIAVSPNLIRLFIFIKERL